MNSIIETRDLTRRFAQTVAVDHLTLDIRTGEVFGLLGHNGAGKTTAVRLLNGVLDPHGGQARVLGLDPTSDGPALRRQTGVLTETPSLEERLTARRNLHFYADLYDVPRGEVAARVAELLASFDLADRADEKVGTYSKGMKQRLALARALLHNPRILFLDEPTAGLDPVATRHVHDLITRLSGEGGHTILLCTHNLAEAQQLCDRVAVLEHGRLLALGTPRELASQLGRGSRLEIEMAPEDQAVARDILQSRPNIREVSWDHGVATTTGADYDAIPGLLAALVSAGVRIYRVAPQVPSLEDVYFALHGEREG